MEEELRGLAILNGDGIVVNKIAYLSESDVYNKITAGSEGRIGTDGDLEYVTLEEFVLYGYDNTHTYMVFSTDKSITNNQPEIGYKYDQSLNAFIPPRQNDTYILNTETYEWEPDPNLEYNLYGDDTRYKWENGGWRKIITEDTN